MSKKQSRYFVVAMVALSIILSTIIGCRQIWNTEESEPVGPPNTKDPVTAIQIAGPQLVNLGTTIQLHATVTPSDAEQEVTWSSGDTNTATIDNLGKVTGLALGPVVITAASQDTSGIQDTHVVSVVNEDVEVDTGKDLALMATGFTIPLSRVATISFSEVKSLARAMAWQLSDGANATLTADITALQTATMPGPVSITFVATHTRDASKQIAKTVTASVINDDVVLGAEYALYARDYTVASSLYSRDDTDILTSSDAIAWKLSDGTPGTAIVTDKSSMPVTPTEGDSYPVTLSVQEEPATSTSVDITVTTPITSLDVTGPTEVAVGTTETLTATVLPAGANQVVTWSSASGNATVDSDGVVTGVTVGPAVITATATDGSNISDSHTISVTDDDTTIVGADDLAIRAAGFELHVSEATGLNESQAILKAGALIWTLAEGIIISPEVDKAGVGELAAIQTGVLGSYALTFSGDHPSNGKSIVKEVRVQVVDDETITDSDADLALRARGFSISWGALSALNEANAITRAGAAAWTLSGAGLDAVPPVYPTITVNSTQLAAIKTGSIGTPYNLTFTATHPVDLSKTLSKTVEVQITAAVGSITIDGPSLVKVAETIDLDAEILPPEASQTVLWSSDDTTKATVGVNTGKVTGVALGSVTITATSDDGSGANATHRVTVIDDDTTTGGDGSGGGGEGTDPSTHTLALRAKDFSLNPTQAASIVTHATLPNTNGVIQHAEALAWRIADNFDLTDTIGLEDETAVIAAINAKGVAGQGGFHNLSLYVTDGADTIDHEITVSIITDDGTTTTGPDATDPLLALFAEGFAVTLAEAANLSLDGTGSGDTTSGILDLSHAVAWNMANGTDLTDNISLVNQAQLNAIKTSPDTGGRYELQLTVSDTDADGAVVDIIHTIYVTVGEGDEDGDGTTVGPDPSDPLLAIQAQGFTIDITDTAALTEDSIKGDAYANVSAWIVATGSMIPRGDIIVNNAEFTAIQQAGAVGGGGAKPYTITFTAEHPDDSAVLVNKKITVNVDDEHTVIGPDPDDPELALRAKGFAIPFTSLASFTEAQAITNAGPATAWNRITGDPITPTVPAGGSKGLSALKAQGGGGKYDLLYKAEDSGIALTKDVPVTLTDNNTKATADDLAIQAYGFVISWAEKATLTIDQAVAKAGPASAWEVSTGAAITPVTITNISNVHDALQGGLYWLNYQATNTETAKSIDIDAPVTIDDDNTTVGTSYALYAEDFTILADDVPLGGLSDSTIETRASVHAWQIIDGATTPVTITGGSAIPQTIGEYPVTVAVSADTSVKRVITVKVEAGGASASQSEVSLITTNPQDVADKHTLEVTLKDSHGNTITSVPAGTVVNFAATADVAIGTATTGSAYSHSLTAGASGTFTVDLTSTKASGYSTAVTMGTAPATPLTGSSVSYSFIDGDTSTGPDTGGGGDPSDHDLALRAKDFIIDITSGDSPLASGDAAVIAVAEASAWVLEDSRTITPSVSPSPSALVGVTTSAYEDITFTAVHPNDSAITISKTIRGTVVGDDAVIEPADDLLLAATSFKLPLYKASSLVLGTAGSGGIVDKASARAWSLSGEGTVAITIANAAELTAIQQAAQAGGGGAKDYTLTLKATHSESGKTITKAITVHLFDMQATLPTEIYTGQEIEVTTTIASGGFLSFSDITWTVDTSIDTGDMSATLNTATGKLTLKGITAGEVGIKATGPAGAEWNYGNIRVHQTNLNALEDGTGTSTTASNFVAKDKTITLQVTGDFQADPEVTWSVAPVTGQPASTAVTLTEDTTDQTKATLRGDGEGKVRVTATINGVDTTHDVTVYQLGGTIANMVVGESRILMPSSTIQSAPTVVLPLTPQDVETSGGLDIDDIVWSVKAGSIGVVSFLGTPEDKEGKITLEAVGGGDITLVATGPGKGEWEFDFTINDNGVEIGGGGDGSGGGTDGDSDGDGLVDNADLVAQGKSITLGVQGMSTITSIEWKVETPLGASGAANFAGSTTSTSNTPTLTGTAAGEVEVILTINGTTAGGITLSNHTLPVHTITVYNMSVSLSPMVEGTTSGAITPALNFGTSGNTPVTTRDLNWTPDTASWVLATGEAATVTELASGDIKITAHYEATSTTIEATGPGNGSWSFPVTVTDNGTEIGGGGDGSGGGTDGDSDGDGVADNADLVAVGGAITLGVQGMSTITSIEWKVETPAGGSGAANFAGSNTSNSNTPTLTGTAVGEVEVTVTLSGTTSANEAITNFILQHQVDVYTMTAAIPNPLLVVLSPETVTPVIDKPAGSWVTIADLTWSVKAGNVADVSVTIEADSSLTISSGPTLGAATLVATGPGKGEWEFDTTVDYGQIEIQGPATVPVTGKIDLIADGVPAGETIVWSVTSGGGSIATNGRYTAGSSTGTVTVEASWSGLTDTHTITVWDLTLTPDKTSINVGDKTRVRATSTPGGINLNDLAWSTNPTSKGTVPTTSKGSQVYVTGTGGGNVTVKATYGGVTWSTIIGVLPSSGTFKPVWRVGANTDVTLPLISGDSLGLDFNSFYIDWGDGTPIEYINANNYTSSSPTHRYTNAGTYTTTIFVNSGSLDLSSWSFQYVSDSRNHIIDVAQWGKAEFHKPEGFGTGDSWQDGPQTGMFRDCENLTILSATDGPTLSGSMKMMFYDCANFVSGVGHWDMRNVTIMGWMFTYTDFKEDLFSNPYWAVGRPHTTDNKYKSLSEMFTATPMFYKANAHLHPKGCFGGSGVTFGCCKTFGH